MIIGTVLRLRLQNTLVWALDVSSLIPFEWALHKLGQVACFPPPLFRRPLSLLLSAIMQTRACGQIHSISESTLLNLLPPHYDLPKALIRPLYTDMLIATAPLLHDAKNTTNNAYIHMHKFSLAIKQRKWVISEEKHSICHI
jgi:hypothetical protein